MIDRPKFAGPIPTPANDRRPIGRGKSIMSDTKRTPGPWSVINRGEPTLQVNRVTAWYVGGQPKAEDPVAVVYFNGTQEGAANAALIASAPDLFAACQAALRFAEFVADKNGTRNQARDINAHEELFGTAAQLRDAIAKAEGK